MISKYWEKFSYLVRRQRGNCAIAESRGKRSIPTSLHHRCANSKVNRKRYPLLMDSLWNLAAVNMDRHLERPSWGKIRDREAFSREEFLKRHPGIAAAVNMENLWQ